MPRVNTPQYEGLQNSEHKSRQLRTPNATGSIITLTPGHRIADTAFGRIVIHFDLWVFGKQDEAGPVIVQAG